MYLIGKVEIEPRSFDGYSVQVPDAIKRNTSQQLHVDTFQLNEKMEIQSYFSEGAYDEALETSAQHILRLVSQNSPASSSCGYSSDDEASRNQEVSLDVLEARSTSSSDGPFASFADDLEHDIESEIDFLQEKQNLLKRAISAMKREDMYEASRARELMLGKFERDVSSLWDEAKEIIDNLNQAENTSNLSDAEVKEKSDRDVGAPRPGKKQRIDTSSVACIRSALIGDGNMDKPLRETVSPTVKLTLNASWMGYALSRTVTKSLSGNRLESVSCVRGWEIVDDLSLGALVVPPPLCCLQNGVELKEAIALTSDPQ